MQKLTKPFLWAGLLLMFSAAALATWRVLQLRTLHRATGRVIEVATVREPDATLASATQISFVGTRLTGTTISTFTLRPSPFDGEIKPGEEVPVAYPADRPADADVVTWQRVYGTAIAIGLLGTVLFDAGCLLLIASRVRRRSTGQAGEGRARQRDRYAHFFGGSDSQRPLDR